MIIPQWWFSQGPSISSTNKTDYHDIIEILLKVALNTIKQTNKQTKHIVNMNQQLLRELWPFPDIYMVELILRTIYILYTQLFIF
jgi:hypothetical protein